MKRSEKIKHIYDGMYCNKHLFEAYKSGNGSLESLLNKMAQAALNAIEDPEGLLEESDIEDQLLGNRIGTESGQNRNRIGTESEQNRDIAVTQDVATNTWVLSLLPESEWGYRYLTGEDIDNIMDKVLLLTIDKDCATIELEPNVYRIPLKQLEYLRFLLNHIASKEKGKK